MSAKFETISPVDGKRYVERAYATPAQVQSALRNASSAQLEWRTTPIEQRLKLLAAFVDAAVAERDAICEELTMQMGRPAAHAPSELTGFADRGHAMVRLATEALADVRLSDKAGFDRFITREPLGVVLVLVPWNYPWLTAVNAIVAALAAGNTVLLKHADQTPLVAERLTQAAAKVGLPGGVLNHLHMTHETTGKLVADDRVSFVCFTGSVSGGRAITQAAAHGFSGVALELGGKDPAYVRPDADLSFAVPNLVEGAFFNAGQSCCAVERIYVHADVFDEFVQAYCAQTRALVLGDPRKPETTLGPVVSETSAATIVAQVEQALDRGARALIDPKQFDSPAPAYLAPQVLVDVDHTMDVMTEETFGPTVGIMRVTGDPHALELMNDSRYGLTASIWSADLDACRQLGRALDTGTVFANRCDYLDPELPWVGVKDSGRGCSLSTLGYMQLTRPKAFHIRSAPT